MSHARQGGATSKLRRLVYARLEPGDYRQLQQEANARGLSGMACARECLREYFALRAEMASVVAAPGKPGDRHTGLIHSLLARTEERLAATIDAQTTELIEELRRLAAMLDRLVLLYLLHTPEVAHELQEGAVASANRRYANYRQAVNDLLSTGGINGNGAAHHVEEGDGQ